MSGRASDTLAATPQAVDEHGFRFNVRLHEAPIGWGFPEGYPLDGIGPESLPDLPFLKFLPSYKRNDAICSAIKTSRAARAGATR